MIKRITLLNPAAFLIAALIAVTLFTPSVAIPNRQDGVVKKNRLIVHEWGTFTTVSGADGTAYYWNPLIGPSELPGFVYGAPSTRQVFCSKCELTLARMETPVLYFYTGREMKVSVNVGFPEGKITEWYPQARSTGRGIDWGSITVLPGAQADLPLDQRKSHYYPARETDAAPIRVESGAKSEHEKFLFYRGIGNFLPPLQVKLAGNQLILRNSGADVIARVILFENRNGHMGWEIHNTLKGKATLTRPALGRSIDSLNCELEEILAAQGLFDKEARAMVKTWQDSWFEEGLRVFYIVPPRAIDAILPITINPLPDELARVFVGRSEIITPEIEREIQDAAREFCNGPIEKRAAAIKTVRRYGRFAEPILREMMIRENNSSIQPLVMAALRAG
jgi:hypothetical protein